MQYVVDALSSNLPGPCLYCIGLVPCTFPTTEHASRECIHHVCPACGIRAPGHASRNCPNPNVAETVTSNGRHTPPPSPPTPGLAPALPTIDTLTQDLSPLLVNLQRELIAQGMSTTPSDTVNALVSGQLGNAMVGPHI